MTKKIYYEKLGRRYVPVAEYDNDLLDSFPKGNHLVMSYPGGQSRRFNIDPNYAAMIAAGRVAHAEAGIKAMQEEADKLMKHEGVRKAYEHFLLMCELTKERNGVEE